MRNSTYGAAGGGELERRTWRKTNKNEASRRGKWMWTLAGGLHIRAAMPGWANLGRENKMAKKKTLKKSKKIQPTKPLIHWSAK
jgi:hypothetical protein